MGIGRISRVMGIGVRCGVLMAVLVALPRPVAAQPAADGFRRVHVLIDVDFALFPNGQLTPLGVDFLTWTRPFPLQDFLQSEAIKQELDLLKDQEEEIEEIFAGHGRAFQKLVGRWKSEAGSGGAGPLDDLVKLQDQTTAKVKEVLLALQWKRLEQLMLRIRYLRRLGFCRTITGKLSKPLNVTDNQMGALVSAALRLANEFERKSMEKRKKVIDELLSVLTDKQRDQLRRELGAQYYGAMGNLDLLIWQLAYDAKSKDSVDSSDPFYGFKAPGRFTLHCDGRLAPSARGLREAKTKTPLYQHVRFVHKLMGADFLKFSDEQLQQLQEFEDQRGKERSRIMLPYQRSVERGEYADKESLERATKQVKERLEEANRKLDRMMADILTPRQFLAIATLARQNEVARRGYVAALVHGTLGERVKISRAQKRKLLSAAPRLRDELIAETARMQQAAWSKLAAVLSSEQQSALRRMIGPYPERFPGSISLFILDGQAKLSHALDDRGYAYE